MNRLNSPHITHITEPDATWSHALHTLQMLALEDICRAPAGALQISFGGPDIFSEEVSLAVQGTLQFVMHKYDCLTHIQVNWQQFMVSTLLTMENTTFT